MLQSINSVEVIVTDITLAGSVATWVAAEDVGNDTAMSWTILKWVQFMHGTGLSSAFNSYLILR